MSKLVADRVAAIPDGARVDIGISDGTGDWFVGGVTIDTCSDDGIHFVKGKQNYLVPMSSVIAITWTTKEQS